MGTIGDVAVEKNAIAVVNEVTLIAFPALLYAYDMRSSRDASSPITTGACFHAL